MARMLKGVHAFLTSGYICLQEQDKVSSDLFTAQAAKTRAESKAAQARHLSDARSVLGFRFQWDI